MRSYDVTFNIIVHSSRSATRLKNRIGSMPDPGGDHDVLQVTSLTQIFKTSIIVNGHEKYIVAGTFRYYGETYARKFHAAIAAIVLRKEFQDIERTWLTIELVYETRWDCKPMRLVAA